MAKRLIVVNDGDDLLIVQKGFLLVERMWTGPVPDNCLGSLTPIRQTGAFTYAFQGDIPKFLERVQDAGYGDYEVTDLTKAEE